MIFTAKIQIELDADAVEEMRLVGYPSGAIVHQVCDEIQGKKPSILTELGELEFTDCEIKTEKEKSELPF